MNAIMRQVLYSLEFYEEEYANEEEVRERLFEKKLFCIGRYYEGEYVDLLTGQERIVVGIDISAYGFYYLKRKQERGQYVIRKIQQCFKGRTKKYRAHVLKGEYPYLPVLEEILSYTKVKYEVNLGLCEIPLEMIVRTRTKGRTNSFASNFRNFRLYLENIFPGQVETAAYDNIVVGENDLEMMEQVIKDGCQILFTTSPVMVPASLKIAASHPDVKILNCSLNISHPTLRTYYARMYEAKFLAGVIAGSMTNTNKLGYIADYPIYGMAASINAFALGAGMVNPYAEVYLDWSTLKDQRVKIVDDPEINYIMDRDMTLPGNASRHFGLYCVSGETPDNLAMATWHWGKLYEKIVRIVLGGTWKEEGAVTGNRAINYWWGMSAGVVDLICSQDLPQGTKRLVELLRNDICSDFLVPFSGEIRAQDGTVMNQSRQVISPKEIITMDWLADNVAGSIPSISDLTKEAQKVVKMQGLGKTQASDT